MAPASLTPRPAPIGPAIASWGPGRRRWLALLLCATPVLLRLPAGTATLRWTYAAPLLIASAVAVVASIVVLRGRVEIHRDWAVYGLGTAFAATSAAVDAIHPIGDQRIGFLVAVAVAVPSIIFGVRRVLDLDGVSVEDSADAALLAISTGFVMWELKHQPSLDPDFDAVLATVGMAYTTLAVLIGAVIVLGARGHGSLDPVRGHVGGGLLLQALGMAVAPDALAGGRYADNALGSGLTALGVVVMVLGLLTAFTERPAPVVRRRPRTAFWWGPMAITVVIFVVHATMRGMALPARPDPVEILLTAAGGIALITRIAGTVRQRERLTLAVIRDRERLKVLLNDVLDEVVILDRDGRIMDGAGGLRTGIFGTAGDVGDPIIDVLAPADRASAEAVLAAARANPGRPHRWEGRVVLPSPEGGQRSAFIEGVVVDHHGDPAVGGTVVTFRDVTTRRRAQMELEQIALYDGLTGLGNRETLHRELRSALDAAGPERPVHVLYCDVDRLKIVNDSLGHQAGDTVIRAVANRWMQLMPPHATLARVSGDEFVVCYVQRSGGRDPLPLARDLLSVLQEPLDVDGYRLTVSASIGLATVTEPGASPDAVLRDADAALYDAKARGRSCVSCFDRSMREAAMQRLTLEQDLREALDEPDSIEVYLQPVVALAEGRATSFEALLRWQHPVRGWVPPPAIVDVAEDTGLIVPLGERVLGLACAALARIRHATGLDLSVSVNASAIELGRASYLSAVQAALVLHDLPPSALTIEVTESTILDPAGRARSTLNTLSDAGIRISLDDFGTGYSALSYIGTFPLDQLKLDRSFVVGAVGTPTGDAVLEGILSITTKLGIPVVAEGLETERQVEMMRDLGTSHGQGWFYAKAMPVQEALRYAADSAARTGHATPEPSAAE